MIKHFRFCLAARVLWCCLFLVSTSPAQAHAQTSTRPPTKWALLVGIDNYQNEDITPLRYAVADTKGMRAALLKNGFPANQLFTMTSDATGVEYPSSLNVVKRLGSLAERVQPGDTFLFYFSGHGYQRTEGHFLGTADADPSDAVTLEKSSLSLALLRRQMARIKARNAIFILDACRNDPYRGKGDSNNVLTDSFSKDLQLAAKATGGGQSGSAVLLACSEGERAWEWPEFNHGIFTYYLMEGLNGAAAEADGKVTMTSLGDYVQQKVGDWALRNFKTQTPDLQQFGAAKIVLTQMTPGTSKPDQQKPTSTVELPQNLPSQITIESNPTGAHIFADGEQIGTTPFTWPAKLGAAHTRQVKLEVRLAGHLAEPQTVTLAQNEAQTIQFKLKPMDSKPAPAPILAPDTNDKTPEVVRPLPTTQVELRQELSALLEAAGNFHTADSTGRNVLYAQSLKGIIGGYFLLHQEEASTTAPAIPDKVNAVFDISIPFRLRDISEITVDNKTSGAFARVNLKTRGKSIKVTGQDRKQTFKNEVSVGFKTAGDAERFALLLQELLKHFP